MPQEIKITDEQIKLAEGVLLNGKSFDQQRLEFIKDLGTFDLHAVPGSGKTTALLAKLIALEQHMPFENGSGVLVLSHTNAAVDEIKSKIGHLCPRLFNYPNFVGTIQGFTDIFLTIPYYKIVHRKRPVRIDDEIYKEHHWVEPKLQNWLTKNRPGDGNKIIYDYRLREGDILKLKRTDEDFPFVKKSNTYQTILALKKQIREDGFICFDDAYILAMEYLQKFPRIIQIINKRFKYVFVDEMQDMDAYQYTLLETLFASANDVGYQRIGDKNQAIYTSDEAMQAVWQGRAPKELNGSHRLSPLVASIVEPLAVDAIAIKGQKTRSDGSAINIKPMMFVYAADAIEEVIPRFSSEIKKLVDDGTIDLKTDDTFRAIAWTTAKPDDNEDVIKLNHYHSKFSKEQQKLQINYPCLESYLHYYQTGSNKLASIRKSLLNGLLRAFRIEGVSHPVTGRTFTKRSFLDHMKTDHKDAEPAFKLYLYRCAKLIAEDKVDAALKLFSKVIEASLRKLGSTIDQSKSFIATKHTGQKPVAEGGVPTQLNQYCGDDGIVIEIGTVHAVKGQTHTCTLYMESFYQKAVEGKGNYESSRIADQLQGIAIPQTAHKFIKQSLKMAYVGFSRPTHLLGFAVHKSRFDALYAGKDFLKNWDIKEVKKPVK